MKKPASKAGISSSDGNAPPPPHLHTRNPPLQHVRETLAFGLLIALILLVSILRRQWFPATQAGSLALIVLGRFWYVQRSANDNRSGLRKRGREAAGTVVRVFTLTLLASLAAWVYPAPFQILTGWTMRGTYKMLSYLAPNRDSSIVPIIIDTACVKTVKEDSSPWTDRKSLANFIDLLVQDKVGPKEIGMDIDFHEANGGLSYPRPADSDAFMTRSIKANLSGNPCPVYLGTYGALATDDPQITTLPADPKALASVPQMAVDLSRPENSAYVTEYVVSKSRYQRSLSRALAYEKDDTAASANWLLKPVALIGYDLQTGSSLRRYSQYQTYLVDYSWKDQIPNPIPLSAYLANSAEGKHLRSTLADRIVLLGSVHDPGDKIDVPGYGLNPGIYCHACGCMTLLEGRLYEFSYPFEPDVAISLLIIVFSLVFLLPTEKLNGRGSFAISLLSAAVFLTLITLLLRWDRLVFPNAFLAVIGFVLDAPAEWCWRQAKKTLFPHVCKWFVTQSETGGEAHVAARAAADPIR